MAETGIQLNPGSGGKTVDTETSPSSGFELQRIKLALGAVGFDDGDVSAANPLPTAAAGSIGGDYSANQPTPPKVGVAFGAGGPYAGYVIVATVPASASRLSIDVENNSGAQIAVMLDDGTAAAGSTPTNVTVFALAGGAGVGSQGGSWVSTVEKGRVQIYAPSSGAQVAVRVN